MLPPEMLICLLNALKTLRRTMATGLTLKSPDANHYRTWSKTLEMEEAMEAVEVMGVPEVEVEAPITVVDEMEVMKDGVEVTRAKTVIVEVVIEKIVEEILATTVVEVAEIGVKATIEILPNQIKMTIMETSLFTTSKASQENSTTSINPPWTNQLVNPPMEEGALPTLKTT